MKAKLYLPVWIVGSGAVSGNWTPGSGAGSGNRRPSFELNKSRLFWYECELFSKALPIGGRSWYRLGVYDDGDKCLAMSATIIWNTKLFKKRQRAICFQCANDNEKQTRCACAWYISHIICIAARAFSWYNGGLDQITESSDRRINIFGINNTFFIVERNVAAFAFAFAIFWFDIIVDT